MVDRPGCHLQAFNRFSGGVDRAHLLPGFEFRQHIPLKIFIHPAGGGRQGNRHGYGNRFFQREIIPGIKR